MKVSTPGTSCSRNAWQSRPDETGGSLHDRLADLAPPLLLQALDLLEAGQAPRQPQQNELATYAGKLSREDGRIDWNEEPASIERKIRAWNPWPGAFTTIEAEGRPPVKLKIFRARLEPGAAPGPGLAAPDGSLRVGDLVLTEVQLEGRKRMPVPDLLRGAPWLAAARLAAPGAP